MPAVSLIFSFLSILLLRVIVSWKLNIVLAKNGCIKLGNCATSILSFNLSLIAAAVSMMACLFWAIRIESLDILLDKEIVSLPILLDNMVAVSEMFNFKAAELPEETLKALILLDKEIVSAPILSETNFVLANKPSVGKVTLLAPVVVIVKSPIPLVVILLAIVMFLPLLFTPVPPFILGKIVVMVVAESAKLALAALKE